MSMDLTPLERMPRAMWQAKVIGERTLQIGMFGRQISPPEGTAGDWYATYWLTLPMSALPNPFLSIDDLEFLGVLPAYRRYVATVGKPVGDATAGTAPAASQGSK